MGDRPLEVCVPETIEEVQRCIGDAALLGERVVPRGAGTSRSARSGLDPSAPDRGRLLSTRRLDGVLQVDEPSMTVTAMAGVPLAQLDDLLAARGLGLPVTPERGEATVGGFCSVGGVGAGSHRHGLFVDTVLRIQYVGWDGKVGWCGRAEDPERFDRLRAGLGRFGVIVALTAGVIRTDKRATILRNERTRYRTLEAFLAGSAERLAQPGSALYQRGTVVESLGWNGRASSVGRFSAWTTVPQTRYAQGRGLAVESLERVMGSAAAELPARPRWLRNRLLFRSPEFESIRSIERGGGRDLHPEPTLSVGVLAPMAVYPQLLRESFGLMRDFRDRYRCVSSISVGVRGIRSTYLAQGRQARAFCELAYRCEIRPTGPNEAVFEELIGRLDDLTLERGGFRTMESRTSADPERRARLDPNTFYARSGPAVGSGMVPPGPSRRPRGTGPDGDPDPAATLGGPISY